MLDLVEKIAQVDEIEIEGLLKAVMQRCAELFPDLELHVISLQKNSDRDEQLDRIIELLRKIKTFS